MIASSDRVAVSIPLRAVCGEREPAYLGVLVTPRQFGRVSAARCAPRGVRWHRELLIIRLIAPLSGLRTAPISPANTSGWHAVGGDVRSCRMTHTTTSPAKMTSRAVHGACTGTRQKRKLRLVTTLRFLLLCGAGATYLATVCQREARSYDQ